VPSISAGTADLKGVNTYPSRNGVSTHLLPERFVNAIAIL
jgi:hypothetical protein